MTHYKSLTDAPYLGAWSLLNDDAKTYHDIVVTITGTSKEQVYNSGELTNVLTLHLKDSLPMILNATNQKTVAAITGTPMVELWIGKQIILFVEKIKVGKEITPALRIRPKLAPTKVKEDLNSEHPKWADACLAVESGNATIDQLKKRYTLTAENEASLTLLTNK